MILDLGCGGNLHEGAVGIDIVGKPHTAADIVCNLGFEPIPLDDNVADEVICHHFLEHIPGVVNYYDNGWKKYHPIVFLFNEIYRVLNNGGILTVTVPLVINGHVPHQQGFQDFTHVMYWTPETVRYFSGDFYGFHDVYHHTSRFVLDGVDLSAGWFMRFRMTAIKDLPEDHPYLLRY